MSTSIPPTIAAMARDKRKTIPSFHFGSLLSSLKKIFSCRALYIDMSFILALDAVTSTTTFGEGELVFDDENRSAFIGT
jgi:hypothetical protein